MTRIRHELGRPFGIMVLKQQAGGYIGVVTAGTYVDDEMEQSWKTEVQDTPSEALEAARAHPAYRHILSVEAHTGNFRKKFQKGR